MEQRDNKLYEENINVNLKTVQEITERIDLYFKERVWIYAVLDYAVGFGVFEENQFLLRLGNQKEPVPLDWNYLRELRIFNKYGELRLTPIKERWVGRFRGCNPESNKAQNSLDEFYIDERQKLWGRAKENEKIKDMHWSLLTSDRGTRIWVPIEIKEQGEAAICVRKFMKTPTADRPELVFQTDIRMVDFCLWNEENTKGGQCLDE